VYIKDLILTRILRKQRPFIGGKSVYGRDLRSPIENSLFMFKFIPSVSRYLAVLEMRTNMPVEYAACIFIE
jgi:hypothetical protein